MAWDWENILKTVNDVSKGGLIGMKINEWMDMPESEGFEAIEDFINESSTEMIDNMDVVLLNHCNMVFDVDDRKKIIKYYAYFKLGEYKAYGKWRGFPE